MSSTFTPIYSPWRHGGYYVNNVRYPSGAVGCVSNNYPDKKWRIVCDSRPGEHTYPTRDAAARAERALVQAMKCDCKDNVVPGAIYPIAPDGDTSVPYVQKCDQCERFPDDIEAAKAVAIKLGGRLCFVFDSPEDYVTDIAAAWVFRPFVIKPETSIEPEVWK